MSFFFSNAAKDGESFGPHISVLTHLKPFQGSYRLFERVNLDLSYAWTIDYVY